MRGFRLSVLLLSMFVLLSASSCEDVDLVKTQEGIEKAQKVVIKATERGYDFGYGGIITTILTAAAGGIAAWQGQKHKQKADNYREGIEAGINDGSDQTVVNVAVMKDVLDKKTKAHFNNEGSQKL